MRLDQCSLAEDDPRERNRLAVLSRLTGRRSLAGLVKVLRPAAGWLRDGPENAATLEWREPMDNLTVVEARAQEWPQEWLEEGRRKGFEQGQQALLCRQASRRFGTTAGGHLAEALADVRDPSRLEAVADLLVDCATEAELLGKLNGTLA